MRVVLAAAVLAAAVAVPASARAGTGDYCVGLTGRDGCTTTDTLQEALAMPDRERIYVGAGGYDVSTPMTDGGRPVEIKGDGTRETLLGAVELTSGGSRISDARLSGELRLAGRAERVRAGHGVTLIAGPTAATTAQLAQSVVLGPIAVTGPSLLDDVDVTADASDAAALTVTCATALGRGITVRGDAPHAVATGCAAPPATASLELRSSLLPGGDPVAAGSSVRTFFSEHADDHDATATNRLEPGAPLIDAGDPAALSDFEPFVDANGDTRITDGDGDGVLRRDVGAYELQPPAAAVADGNVLADGGAETALSAWTGTFGVATYGTPSLLNLRQGAALGGGRAFFSAGDAASADALQRIDLVASAAAIDTGAASAQLSGLLGGYGNDADTVTVTAAFRDPEGKPLGALQLGPVTPEQRMHDTNLLPRATRGAIPPRTRAIDVMLHAERAAGSYTDAYADNLALTLSVPGVPVAPPVQPTDPIVPGLKPYSGVSILTARPAFSKRWRAPVVVACPDATVGRCAARLELVATLPRATTRTRIAHFAYASLAPGQAKRITLRMLVASRRALKRKHQIRARLLTTSRDGQGVQRERTVPVRLVLPASKSAAGSDPGR